MSNLPSATTPHGRQVAWYQIFRAAYDRNDRMLAAEILADIAKEARRRPIEPDPINAPTADAQTRIALLDQMMRAEFERGARDNARDLLKQIEREAADLEKN